MEAVHPQPRRAIRTWQVLASTVLLLALLIGGTGGYLIRLATAPVQTVVRTAAQPAAAPVAEEGGSSGLSCSMVSVNQYHFKAC